MRERYDELYTTILKPIIYILFLSYIFLFSTSKKREKMKIGSSYVIFIFLIFWMILSTAINGITTYTIQGDSYRKESLLDQICYFVFFFFVSSKIKNDAAKKRIIFIQIIIGLLVAFIGFYLYDIQATLTAHNGKLRRLEFLQINKLFYLIRRRKNEDS